jgi:hypothetical protein
MNNWQILNTIKKIVLPKNLVPKMQLINHEKFNDFVWFATMDLLNYRKRKKSRNNNNQKCEIKKISFSKL